MSGIYTHTGKLFDPWASASEVLHALDIVDIAHALSNICRFNGHTEFHYSVAQHSVHLCEHFVKRGDNRLARAALMHDAAEAYVGDIPRPFRDMVPEFNAAEERLLYIIGKRFGIAKQDWRELRDHDTQICIEEARRHFAGPSVPRWTIGQDALPPTERIEVDRVAWTASHGERRFPGMYDVLFPPVEDAA